MAMEPDDSEDFDLVTVFSSDEHDAEILIHSVAFSPDGKGLAVARADAAPSHFPTFPIFIDPLTGRRLASPLAPNLSHEGRAHAILFSPDGRWTMRRIQQRVQVFETATWQLRFEVNPAWPVVFSPQGDLAAAASEGMVRVWRMADWTEVTGFLADRGPIAALSFSADGRTLATGSSGGAVRLWNVATGRELMTLADDMAGVLAVAFSPDGRTLAASGAAAQYTYELRIWNLAPSPQGDSTVKPLGTPPDSPRRGHD